MVKITKAQNQRERRNEIARYRRKVVQKTFPYLHEVMTQPSIARIFYLILDGVDTNKALADAYYSSGKGHRRKNKPNPNTISIFLKRLLNAGLIQKGSKKGREQPYEI